MDTATWYHCSVKVISRSTGRTAIAAAAYRSGEKLHDAQLDQTYDYTRRRGVEETFILAPDNAPSWAYNLESLWNEAQAKDNRVNSRLAREIELALPSAIDAEGRAAIAREFSQHVVERYGVAVSAALHEPSRYGDEHNYHAHILFTTRRMDEEGFGVKTRELDDIRTGAQEIEHLREYAASLINDYLEDAGSSERVDHRSYEDRGIDQTPTGHLGVEAAAMERRGEHSRIGDENREIAEHNRSLEALQNELAALDAEIERELEKEFLQSAPEADIIPSFPFPAVHEGAPPSVLVPAPEPVKTWEEQKREAQSPFRSEIVARMEKNITRIGRQTRKESKKPAPEVAAPEKTWEEQKREAQSAFNSETVARMAKDIAHITMPIREESKKPAPAIAAPEKTWEEQKREAQSAFTSRDVAGMVKNIAFIEMPTRKESKKPAPEVAAPEKTWEEQKREAQSAFNSEFVTQMESDIREHGEIREYGLGKNWFDRSLTMFENLYYGTIEQVRGVWQRHITDRDRSVRRERGRDWSDRSDDPDINERDR